MSERKKKLILFLISLFLTVGMSLFISYEKLKLSIIINETKYLNYQSIGIVYYFKNTGEPLIVSRGTPLKIIDAENETDKNNIRYILNNIGKGNRIGIKIIRGGYYNGTW